MYDQYSLQYKSDSFWRSDNWIIVSKSQVEHVVNNLVANNFFSNGNFLIYFFLILFLMSLSQSEKYHLYPECKFSFYLFIYLFIF